MSLIDNILNSIRKSDSMDRLPCYTLYVHHDENEDLTEDDIAEPAAFQISVEMKWRDLQDMICSEIGKAKADKGFLYYDDENDEVRIDSQEEYETALHICQKDKRDLHIYTLRPPLRRSKRRKKRGKATEKRKSDEGFAVLQPEQKTQYQDDAEPFHPPTVTEAPVRDQYPPPATNEEADPQPQGATSATSQAAEGATAAPPAYFEEEAPQTSEEPAESDQETKPMPDVGNYVTRMIKKEVREAIADELDDVWRFINALKRDLNHELDAIGDQLAVHSAQLPEIKRNENDQENQTETSVTETEAREPEASLPLEVEEEANYAATFICESLVDGSRVHTGEIFEKHWVFRNDGNVNWNENTKLHLLDETCDPPVATGASLSEWGSKSKSVSVPPLKQGESGVVCAEHTTPAHACNYTSSWRLSQNSSPFGPRVWCNIHVQSESTEREAQLESGTPVDQQKSLESYEDIQAESTSAKKSLEQAQKKEESLHRSVVPEGKVEIELKSPNPDDASLHSDNSIMSFNMTDISDGAKYIESHAHESAPYNPAVTSVEQPGEEEETLQTSYEKKDNAGASVDGDDHSPSSESPVMVSLLESKQQQEEEEEQVLHEPENYFEEEPRTLENEDESDDGADLYSSKYEENENPRAVEDVENFHEPPLTHHDSDDSSSEGDCHDEHEDEPNLERQNSEDLHSVDYQLDDDTASMMSYASDFVVVPLPECFDVNKPLSESQYVTKKDSACDPIPQEEAATEPPAPASLPKDEAKDVAVKADSLPQYPPEVAPSDSENESEPSSMRRIMRYQSEEDSSIVSTTTPAENAPTPKSVTPKVSLAPNFSTPQNADNVAPEEAPQNEPKTPETPQPDSMDDSLTEKITKEFDEFLSNPKHPITHPTKPKIPMNQMATSQPKTSAFDTEPKPVPPSVLQMDDPYPLPTNSSPREFFPPFEQGWRRNPLPLPSSVINNEDYVPFGQNRPTPAPRHPSQVPRSEFTLAQDTQPTESTLPSHPFAVASPSTSIVSPDPVPTPRRPPSPRILHGDNFYPAAGTNQAEDEPNEPQEPEIFRTPPPSPPPRQELESSPLDQLYEMGFHDIDLNLQIYTQCEQDLNRTVQALVLRAEADQEMMA